MYYRQYQACNSHQDVNNKPKTYPPKHPKNIPPRATIGSQFTLNSGTDKYGFTVVDVLDNGWGVIGQRGNRKQVIRWIHTGGWWRPCCCVNDFKRTRQHSWIRWGHAETYIDPHF